MEKIHYNSTVTSKILITPDLMILRIRTDEPRTTFQAGQFTTIGLTGSESRCSNSVMPLHTLPDKELVARPYSIASANHETQNFEFYISHVKSGQLTPRLFNLALGSRIWVDDKILGIFNLNDTPPECNIVMIATGTGLAPYISFIRSHIGDHRNIKMAIIHGASYSWDLGYYSELSFIDHTFDNFFYFPTILKKDNSWNGLSGYIENHLEAGILENQAGIEIHPDKTHFFLCGNPKMVESVSVFLQNRGFCKHSKDICGSLHVEEY